MRSLRLGSALLLASTGLACSATKTSGPVDVSDVSTGDGTTDGPIGVDGFTLDGDGGWPPCVGLECKRVPCGDGTKTSLSGTVYEPSGKMPLYNVVVYIPNEDPLPFPKGVTCDKCGSLVTGAPIVTTRTDSKGRFTLDDVPVDSNVPLIIQVGKWRRKFVVPTITACTANSAPKLLLPKSQSEGDMPRIAIATGGHDALECLFLRIGIDPSELGGEGSKAAIHLYNGTGGKTASGSVVADGFWGDLTKLKTYDMVLLSCEGSTYPSSKPPSALTAMHDYASAGGRIFASHDHYYWFYNGPADFQAVATWAPGTSSPTEGDFTVDQTFPKGSAFAEWLVNVGGSTTKGVIHLRDIRDDVSAVNTKTSQRWIYQDTPKYFTFKTPILKPAEAQCGRVAFTDLHVGSGNAPGGTLPDGCLDPSVPLSPQEKALVFLILDLASCG